MGTSQSTADGMPTGYGLGWELQRWGGKPTASHGGGPPGVTTLLLVAPARACAVVALTNRGGAPGLAELVRRVAGAACP